MGGMLITVDFYELFMQIELRFSLSVYRTRNLLWLLFIPTHVVNWSYYYILGHRNCVFRIRLTVRPNIILRGYCNYKSSFSNSLRGNRSSTMTVRRICSR